MTEQSKRIDPQFISAPADDQPIDLAGPVFTLDAVRCSYGEQVALDGVTMTIAGNEITAFIGPSGCGKSTLLRTLNRMNDFIPEARVEGHVNYRGVDLYGPDVDSTEVRRRIGMVFQTPHVFPKSIFDNVAYGPRVNGIRGDLDDIVEDCLTKAALWDEVKAALRADARTLSKGQQQRLVIARCLAVRPEVILMDEPCGALDPIATARIEELMRTLLVDYPIVLVTHDMQQAARVSDRTAFFTSQFDEQGNRHGRLVEYGPTRQIFTAPQDRRTEDYISGRFG